MSKIIHSYLRNLFLVCVTAPYFLQADINSYIDEALLNQFSAEERACYENYLQIATGQIETLFFKSIDIIFQREGHFTFPQDVELSLKAFDQLQAKAPPLIHFNYAKLTPFDYAGTCSAMALDFLARYQNTCAKLKGSQKKKAALKSFKKFYTSSSTIFTSRQAAFNTIEVAPNYRYDDFHPITSTAKMQALANFHGLRLTPVTPLMELEQVRNGNENLSQLIDDLPKGCYIIRMLWPLQCEKMESIGHTMVFAKDDDFATFFCNYRYCKNITGYVGEAIRDEILFWGIRLVRIYRAEAGPAGCINLAE